MTLTLSPNVNKCFFESHNVVYCSLRPIVVTVVNSVDRQVYQYIKNLSKSILPAAKVVNFMKSVVSSRPPKFHVIFKKNFMKL